IDETCANAMRCFSPIAQMMAGKDIFAAQPLDCGLEKDLLQPPAMNRELRPFITGLQAARLAPDRLAALGEVGKFAGSHARGLELIEKPELDQLANGVRQHVDTDAERLELSDALEDFGRYADLMQAERQRQSADSATCDENGHGALPVEWI